MRRRGQGGFTYLALLFLVALMGVTLAVGAVIWSTESQRRKERELLYVGAQFRSAIAAYYEHTPGTVKRYPASLDDMLKDSRQAGLVRHLRRVYRDPVGGGREWGILRAADGGIKGVFSMSAQRPIKTGGFRDSDAGFAGAASYSAWRFVYEPQTLAH